MGCMEKGQRLVTIDDGQLYEVIDDNRTLKPIQGEYNLKDPNLLVVFKSMLVQKRKVPLDGPTSVLKTEAPPEG